VSRRERLDSETEEIRGDREIQPEPIDVERLGNQNTGWRVSLRVRPD
jgi:hypothetical protein